MIIAQLDTRHWSFVGLFDTMTEAEAGMKKMWGIHMDGSGYEDNWHEFSDSVQYHPIEVGEVLRDGSPILKAPFADTPGDDLSMFDTYYREEDGHTYLMDADGKIWGAPTFTDGTVEVSAMGVVDDYSIEPGKKDAIRRESREIIAPSPPYNITNEELDLILDDDSDRVAVFLCTGSDGETAVSVLTHEKRGDGGTTPWLRFVGYLRGLRKEWEREYPPMPYTEQEAYDHENPAPLENPMDWEK